MNRREEEPEKSLTLNPRRMKKMRMKRRRMKMKTRKKRCEGKQYTSSENVLLFFNILLLFIININQVSDCMTQYQAQEQIKPDSLKRGLPVSPLYHQLRRARG